MGIHMEVLRRRLAMLPFGVELALCKSDAARAVHAMEDRFFANSIDMLCFLDFSGHFKRLNPAWERTLGFTRQELMSRPFIEFVHPDDRERTLQQNREVRGGAHALSFENRYLCKDGSYRWFRWNAAPDSDEKVIYSVARDVTVSKQAEADRERLVGELQAALGEVKTLREILPICSNCRKIRDDENYWDTVENYISDHQVQPQHLPFLATVRKAIAILDRPAAGTGGVSGAA
jgi:PAS domain S-box-containing protein